MRRIFWLIFLATMTRPVGANQQNAPASQNFPDFPTLRAEILNVIGAAKKQLWLSSDYLTDGEIVSALYIAKYRKLDVKVLLGKRMSRQYMSRLHYLKQQKIPVFIKPYNFPEKSATALLADENLILVNGNLNFLKKRTFQLRYADEKARLAFQDGFHQAYKRGIVAAPPPRPLVGRARHHTNGAPKSGNHWRPPSTATAPSPRPIRSRPPTYNGEADGSFDYNLAPRETRAPKGFPRKLPRRTIMQERHRRGNEVPSGGGNPG